MILTSVVRADQIGTNILKDLPKADIYILGEIHDNPTHHDNQALAISRIAPQAIVFEMISPDQAKAIEDVDRGDQTAMARALQWDESGWPDFAIYHPIFKAAPNATIFGAAVGRDDLIAAMKSTAATTFGKDADAFLLGPLPQDQQMQRETLQLAAHCDALPAEMLPGMVEAQRLRDAVLSRTTLEALDETDGPVVVITGNGHARTDWAMPAKIKSARPTVTVLSIGQLETTPNSTPPYDLWLITDPIDRPDPCEQFR
ncbi:ChaN family lipoprotein [Parasulfitobacter algicola]|uniref:ChaN family lipoprotein n=1 Tax=Parasulfitobacter algicola TaxID=2614809 RepID=UPI0031B61B31